MRTLQLLRDLAIARAKLAPLNDHRTTDAARRKLITSPEGRDGIWLMFYAVDKLLRGDQRAGEAVPDEPSRRAP